MEGLGGKYPETQLSRTGATCLTNGQPDIKPLLYRWEEHGLLHKREFTEAHIQKEFIFILFSFDTVDVPHIR